MKEHSIMQRVWVRLSKCGATIFRNNVGLVESKDGRKIRFGLCKGSSDLVGWISKEIAPEDVGKRVAVFMAVEVKQPSGKVTDEQVRFLASVRASGGISTVAYGEEDVVRMFEDHAAGHGG
jgi:hypothetical protein